MSMNSVKLTLVLNNGDHLTGFVNIMEFQRFSDFIENHPGEHIKLFNVALKDNRLPAPQETIANFILIPKRNVLYYHPHDEQSVKKIDI